MAGVYVAVSTPARVSLSAGTAKTVLTFKTVANFQAQICSAELSPFGTNSSAEPIEWWLEVQTSDGSIAGTAAGVIVTQGPGITTSGLITALYNITSEATPGSTLWVPAIHQQGFWAKEWTPGREISVGGTAAVRVALRAKSAAAVDVKASMLVHL